MRPPSEAAAACSPPYAPKGAGALERSSCCAAMRQGKPCGSLWTGLVFGWRQAMGHKTGTAQARHGYSRGTNRHSTSANRHSISANRHSASTAQVQHRHKQAQHRHKQAKRKHSAGIAQGQHRHSTSTNKHSTGTAQAQHKHSVFLKYVVHLLQKLRDQ